MNNGESIKKYNDALIGYLNQLVNSIENNTVNDTFFTDIAAKLKQHLVTYNMDIAEQGVKTMMMNAFKEYSNILKKHFDSSNIHRINLPPEDTNLANEMNLVTANLSNAVTNMNKIPEYIVLIDTVKSTLKGYFNQSYENYKDLEFEIEQILNEVIVGAFNTFTTTKIDDFTRMILPDLYSIADSITYDTIVNSSIDESGNINEERDQFIRDTMDVDIEESFENGRVVLRICDSDGKTQVYYSTEAMEKLSSYNQLFESSRPGKKADTSNWANDISLNPSMANNIVENNANMAFENGQQTQTQDLVNNNTNPVNDLSTITEPTNNSNEALIKDFLANQNTNQNNDDFSNLTSAVNQPNNNNDFNELTNVLNNNEINNLDNNVNNNEFNNLDNAVNNQEDKFTNLDNPSSIVNFFNNDSNTTNNNEVVFGDLTAPSQTNNEFNNLDNNSIESTANNTTEDDNDLTQVRHMMGIDNNSSSFSGSFSFLPEYDNPNEERDEFIKKTTGIEIDEDTDHKGALYLKVVEPTGREQIYTGKEAVNMIKNFNKAFLDSNPGKKVDTTLIDNFKEE